MAEIVKLTTQMLNSLLEQDLDKLIDLQAARDKLLTPMLSNQDFLQEHSADFIEFYKLNLMFTDKVILTQQGIGVKISAYKKGQEAINLYDI